jgi:hypothetical protein
MKLNLRRKRNKNGKQLPRKNAKGQYLFGQGKAKAIMWVNLICEVLKFPVQQSLHLQNTFIIILDNALLKDTAVNPVYTKPISSTLFTKLGS